MFSYSLELALHGLKRFPKSTVLVVMTVALGLAASMTTLTLLHVLSADPLPGRSPHLYLAWVNTLQRKPINYASLNDVTVSNFDRIKMSDAQTLLAAHRGVQQAAVADMSADVETSDGSHKQKSQTLLGTTADFVPMFGVALRYGRSWTAAEDQARAAVAVIDLDLAQKLFGTGNAVGREIRIKHSLFHVIGVSARYAPQPHFYALQSGAFSGSDHESVFLPYSAALDAGVKPSGNDGCDDSSQKKSMYDTDTAHCAWLAYWVQLDTPAQLAQYRLYLTHYSEQQKSLAGYAQPAKASLSSVAQWLSKQNVVPDNVQLNVWLAGSFLLLCMINVAGLLAARFLRRSGEVGIRRALGAPRRAVFMQHVLESSLACLAGGVLAWPLTLFGLWTLRLQDDGFTDLARLDPLMFASLFVLALLVGVIVGLVPAWRVSRAQPGLQVKTA